jgi:hypothetical protein
MKIISQETSRDAVAAASIKRVLTANPRPALTGSKAQP